MDDSFVMYKTIWLMISLKSCFALIIRSFCLSLIYSLNPRGFRTIAFITFVVAVAQTGNAVNTITYFFWYDEFGYTAIFQNLNLTDVNEELVFVGDRKSVV